MSHRSFDCCCVKKWRCSETDVISKRGTRI